MPSLLLCFYRLVDVRYEQLILRNVNVSGVGDGGPYGDVGATMRAWDAVSNAFVNYFGLQRFGTSSVPTFELGKTLLRHDWDGVRAVCCTRVYAPLDAVSGKWLPQNGSGRT